MSRSRLTPERLALVRLARSDGVGPVAYRRLLAAHAGDPEGALAQVAAAARERDPRGRTPRIPAAAAIEDEAGRLERLGARFLLLDEPDYPPALAALDDAPPVLAVLGDVSRLGEPAVAIVGARNASSNGRRFAEALAAELALAGIVVVSGLARGIDTAAHQGALLQGRTVAAIAGGLDRPYPPENAGLQAAIAEHGGAVVAEAPLGTEPMSRHFPRRNRIIAGLALGCVVVEAAPRSGSLITARLAADAGRELFAVPGSPLDPRARGANDLIRKGEAHLCEGIADILSELRLSEGTAARRLPAPRPPAAAHRGSARQDTPPPPALAAGSGDPAAAVLALLGPDPAAIDDLVRRCQFSASVVAAALAELELDGRVEMLPGSRVSLLAGN